MKDKLIAVYNVLLDIPVKGNDVYKMVAVLNTLKEAIEGGEENGNTQVDK